MTAQHTSASFESFLSSSVKVLLHNAGFRVASSGFESIVQDQSIRQQIQDHYSNVDSARILMFFPDLFVMHDKLDPKKGVFFVRCMRVSKRAAKLKLRRQAKDITERYFPRERIVIVGWADEKPNLLLASWFEDLTWKLNGDTYDASPRSMEDIRQFVKRNFRIQVSEEDVTSIKEGIQSFTDEKIE